jgi:putative cardiolipin synthase
VLTYYLLRAVDRGVRVRLLLDDMATNGMDPALATLAWHPKMEVRIINPYANRRLWCFEALTHFDIATRRMHNNSFSVDNIVTIVGGLNVGDEYYDAHEQVNFGDVDVMAVGPAAVQVERQFDLYWNSDLS